MTVRSALAFLLRAGAALGAVLLGLVAAPVGAVDADPAAQLALGQRIYREGRGATGAPVVAAGAAGTRLEGAGAACATCHRRSGYGSTEGRLTVRPIIGPALRQVQAAPVNNPRVKARLGTTTRPPYDEALLVRALRDGADAAGKPLDPVMPRYVLTEVEARALAAYLFALGSSPSPGVDEHEIHFATVIQPGVAPERRRAMLDVMDAFIRDKDSNMRLDDRRREAGNMRMYRSYRKWVLHVWDLQGPADTWGAQLDALYAQQPVFALLGGLGAASWQPIHAFGERHEIPSVFPLAEWPGAGPNQYSFYLSRGVLLDADVLAKHLGEQGAAGRVVQVFRRDTAGARAADALRTALAGQGAVALEDRMLDGAMTEAAWRALNERKPAALVMWLDATDLGAAPAAPAAPVVYLSSALLGGRVPDAALRVGDEVRLMYPSEPPPKRDARLLRNKIWLHSKGIALTDAAVNTQFLMAVVSDVLGHIMDSFSRDYFVERVEHTVGQTPLGSVHQTVSLGPGQRVAAKGGTIVQVIDRDPKSLRAVSPWIVP